MATRTSTATGHGRTDWTGSTVDGFLGSLLMGLLMPVWLSTVEFPGAPPFPGRRRSETAISLVGHLLYSIPLTLVYARTVVR
ncbi:hypothetical protein ACYJ1Y_11465 [Natrialbaceae archaeon A-gly3]